MTKISDLHEAFRNSFLFKGKTARKISGHKAKKLTESLVASDSGPVGKDKKDGAHMAGSRIWGDGEATWYEMVPPVVQRQVDGTVSRHDYIVISRVDGKTRAFGSNGDGTVWEPYKHELFSEKGDVSCEEIMQILGYKIGDDADSVMITKEKGTKSVESYEEYEDEKDDEESETPEGETGTPEPHETKTPEAEETGSPEPEDDDE